MENISKAIVTFKNSNQSDKHGTEAHGHTLEAYEKTPVDTHAQLTCPSEEKIALEKPKKQTSSRVKKPLDNK